MVYMCRRNSPVNRSCTAVFILFRPLKDLSAEQLVTGTISILGSPRKC